MARETEQLVVSLEARIRDFEKNFQKAGKTANDNFSRIENRAKQSGDRLESHLGKASANVAESFAGLASKFNPVLAAVASLGAAAVTIKKIAASVADIGREARRAGTSVESFQRWSHVANTVGISMDAVTDALKELNIRGDEFSKTGKGSAAEAFQRLGYSAEQVAAKLKDPDRFLTEILGKIQQLDQAAQTRVLDEIFGGTGAEKMAALLGVSVGRIKEMLAETKTLTQAQIDAAAEVERRWNGFWDNMSRRGQAFAVEWASRTFTPYDERGLTPEQIAEKNRQEQVSRVRSDIESYEGRLSDLKGDTFPDPMGERQRETLRISAQLEQLRAKLGELEAGAASTSNTFDTFTSGMDKAAQETAETTTDTGEFRAALDVLQGALGDSGDEAKQFAQAIASIDNAFKTTMNGARTYSEALGIADMAERAKAETTVKNLSGTAQERGQKVFSMLRELGLNPAPAAGVAGNAYQESGFDPTAWGDDGTSHGLFQHHGPRKDRLLAMGGRDNAAVQLALMKRELVEQGLWDQLNSFTDPTEAARFFMDRFERPDPAHASFANRDAYARQAFAQYGDSGAQWEAPDLNPAIGDVNRLKDAWSGLRDVTVDVKAEQQAAAEQAQQFGQVAGNAIKGISNALSDGKLEAHELFQIIGQLLMQLAQMPAFGPAPGAAAVPGGNVLMGLLGSLFGFASGGEIDASRHAPRVLRRASGGPIFGPGGPTDDKVPVLASDGEYIVNAAATRKHGALLEAINSGRVASFAAVGHVGNGSGMAMAAGNVSNVFAPQTSIKVEGGSRGEAADQALASNIAKQVDAAMEAKMSKFAQKNLRNGGMFNQRGFT